MRRTRAPATRATGWLETRATDRTERAMPNQPRRTAPGDVDHPLAYGQRYSADDLRALHPARRPDPLLHYNIHDRSGQNGSGMRRVSSNGDKWCAYCDTPLPRERRRKTCDECHVERERTRRRPVGLAPRQVVDLERSPGTARNDLALKVKGLVDAVDDISARLGIVWSDKVVTGSYSDEGISEVLEACKRAIMASHPLREYIENQRPVPR